MTAMPPAVACVHVIIPAAGIGRRMGPDQKGPKSLIEIAGRAILLHTLATLENRGLRRLSLIVGFQHEHFMQLLGAAFGNLAIEYIVCEDYASTEHGWSLYQAKQAWRRDRQPVLFMDADNVITPELLDDLLRAPGEDLVMVDPRIATPEQDEELVLGKNHRITGFVRGRTRDYPDYVGGFVGMNRFSPAYMERLFGHMDNLFSRRGRQFKYERVFDDLLRRQGIGPDYLEIGERPWINVNCMDNLRTAEAILRDCNIQKNSALDNLMI